MRTGIRFATIAGAAALALVATACGGDGKSAGGNAASPAKSPAEGKTSDVQIAGFKFRPGTVSVAAGTAVTWNNTDEEAHTITSGKPGAPVAGFDGKVDPGESFTFTFSTAGTFAYFCSIHSSMTGELRVT